MRNIAIQPVPSFAWITMKEAQLLSSYVLKVRVAAIECFLSDVEFQSLPDRAFFGAAEIFAM